MLRAMNIMEFKKLINLPLDNPTYWMDDISTLLAYFLAGYWMKF